MRRDVATVPARMLVGQQTAFTVRLRLSMSYGPPMDSGNPAMTAQVTSPAGVVTNYGQIGYAVSGTGVNTILTSNPSLQYKPLQAGTYTVSWNLSGSTIKDDVTCTKQFDAGYRPFFTVTGGDILSGGSIRSWNEDSGSYFGAGTQLAAIATGNIQNFVSGFGLPGGAATRSGSALSFANTTASGTTYGGGYAVNPFSPELPTNTTPWPASSLGLGDATLVDGATYVHSGDLTLSGTLPANKRITIILESGNAIIASNILYGAYANVASIPRLTLLIRSGNILVGSAVTEMHGIYYAGVLVLATATSTVVRVARCQSL
ncbi:hypothetical protein IPL68_03710 [Candidatus Saccharibacteria bacterium]|nr:MAG: hypothetical protein IPL68_03710 [Candidatus Saccharibacteria bacterium]